MTVRQHRKHSIIIVCILLVILGGLFILHQIRQHLAAKASAAVNSAPTVVEMAKVKSQVWHPQIEAIGTVLAKQGIDVTTQVAGVVQHIYFKSGEFVDQGTKLVQLNPSVLQATANQSKANFELDQANYKRYQNLYKKKAVSIAALQKSEATMKADKAQMEEDAATLAQTTISAPFAGKIGLRKINLGQYLAPADVIVSLQSIDPVLVDFSLPEVYLQQIKTGDQVLVTTSSYPGQTFTGKITATNSTLNSDTRTLDFRAEIPNKNKSLMPGMFANVRVVIPTKNNVLTIPQMAVQYSPFGDTVFVVQNGKAVQRYITLGTQRGAEIAVTRGLSADEEIVSVGGSKLQNGTPVTTKAALAAAKQASAEKKAQVKNSKDDDTKTVENTTKGKA
jgi:membrane fusion protein (multidrug efflux system)